MQTVVRFTDATREDLLIIDVVKRRNGDDEVASINERPYERSPCSRVIKHLHMQRAFSIPLDPFYQFIYQQCPHFTIYIYIYLLYILLSIYLPFMENRLNQRKCENNR